MYVPIVRIKITGMKSRLLRMLAFTHVIGLDWNINKVETRLC